MRTKTLTRWLVLLGIWGLAPSVVYAEVSDELEFVGQIKSSNGTGVIILREKDTLRTIVTQKTKGLKFKEKSYSIAEVTSHGVILDDGNAQHLVASIDSKKLPPYSPPYEPSVQEYDTIAVEDYIEEEGLSDESTSDNEAAEADAATDQAGEAEFDEGDEAEQVDGDLQHWQERGASQGEGDEASEYGTDWQEYSDEDQAEYIEENIQF